VTDELEYFPIAANRIGWCPHCPELIQVGDAIVRRPGDTEWAHHRCAIAEDEYDADPFGALAEAKHEFEVRRQTDIATSIVRGPVRRRPQRRKRKQRSAHAA
jgi:hypothetical protein